MKIKLLLLFIFSFIFSTITYSQESNIINLQYSVNGRTINVKKAHVIIYSLADTVSCEASNNYFSLPEFIFKDTTMYEITIKYKKKNIDLYARGHFLNTQNKEEIIWYVERFDNMRKYLSTYNERYYDIDRKNCKYNIVTFWFYYKDLGDSFIFKNMQYQKKFKLFRKEVY